MIFCWNYTHRVKILQSFSWLTRVDIIFKSSANRQLIMRLDRDDGEKESESSEKRRLHLLNFMHHFLR